jgi:uncharacterized protein (DUF58 family)
MLPSRFLLWLLGSLSMAGFALAWLPSLTIAWYVLASILVAAMLVDALQVRRLPKLRLERSLHGVWPVGTWNDVTLTLHHEGGRRVTVELFDDYPTQWELEGLPFTARLSAGQFHTQRYRLRALERGNATFGQAYLRISSLLGLWQRKYRLGSASQLRVFPDFSRLLGRHLHATDQRVPRLGNIRKRRRGEGTDFRQLREYRQGDSMRVIDWKATSRYLKPISREYQEERDQQVVFLLDTGRRMLAQDADKSHFDHALDAVLTLAWVAQKQGDAIGVMTFGKESRWLMPHKGQSGLDRLLSGVYDLQAAEVAPDYLLAAQSLLGRLRKRAFVVLVTNLRDEDDVALRDACKLLSTRHLVLCASLREAALDETVTQPVQQFADALRLAGTEHYLAQRREAIRRLGMPTHSLIDVTPQRLSASLVDRYLEIKESGQL